jgi:2-iminobutanoate/2-iminopropanoate deaminase
VASRTVVTDRAPEAIGPYSQAVRSGAYVFCSGQVALDPSSGDLVGESIEEQTRLAMDNLSAVLEAAGASFDSVVKVTAYLTDMGTFPDFNDVYGSYFGAEPPARATVGVASLPKGALVEVECVAEI